MEKLSEKVIFELPLYIDIPISERARSEKNLKKLAEGKTHNRYWLNKNIERNQNRFLEHKLKELFCPLSVPGYFEAEKIRISYHIERNGNISFDTMNVITMVDKYFLDWLVQRGYLKNDSFKEVSYGGMDGENKSIENKVIAEVEILQLKQKVEKKAVQTDLFEIQ